uniref:Uncharacterized protein n=1 Tax=Tetraselmis sp. GSL018 TaxID=582737 RepID=A0A061R139_9CHLO|eukprot:CAMPEP_0177603452 /NCGR_PEP_ID=MMETSP0419_2-20121207/15521_1 /TAXON_ID=582737 /ORGANISM="Tetraselmis sp., Strain GSL018" /LENGTH=165 /DNA_ID=CAMNT_0019097227 /DNA_START=156 /DNA_END=653 /DNA_ORIENTATION=+
MLAWKTTCPGLLPATARGRSAHCKVGNPHLVQTNHVALSEAFGSTGSNRERFRSALLVEARKRFDWEDELVEFDSDIKIVGSNSSINPRDLATPSKTKVKPRKGVKLNQLEDDELYDDFLDDKENRRQKKKGKKWGKRGKSRPDKGALTIGDYVDASFDEGPPRL